VMKVDQGMQVKFSFLIIDVYCIDICHSFSICEELLFFAIDELENEVFFFHQDRRKLVKILQGVVDGRRARKRNPSET